MLFGLPLASVLVPSGVALALAVAFQAWSGHRMHRHRVPRIRATHRLIGYGLATLVAVHGVVGIVSWLGISIG